MDARSRKTKAFSLFLPFSPAPVIRDPDAARQSQGEKGRRQAMWARALSDFQAMDVRNRKTKAFSLFPPLLLLSVIRMQRDSRKVTLTAVAR
jgi:hypothetical protein